MTILIQWPWLALGPAVLFLVSHAVTKRRLVFWTGVIWILYAVYEFAMKQRWLCTGECNIRVDLLLLYPALVVMSVAAAVSAIRAKQSPPAGR